MTMALRDFIYLKTWDPSVTFYFPTKFHEATGVDKTNIFKRDNYQNPFFFSWRVESRTWSVRS